MRCCRPCLHDALPIWIASGEATLAVGTHALIQEGVEFERLGLAVIDEEHRFGVEQRRKLLHDDAHVLVMSATPIPRSLADRKSTRLNSSHVAISYAVF